MFPITLSPSSNVSSIDALFAAANRTEMPTAFAIYNRPLLPLNITAEDNSTLGTSDTSKMKADPSSHAGRPSPIIALCLAVLLL